MARPSIPSPLDRRHLLEQDLDARRASQIAEAYLAEGRKNEALDFLVKAGDPEALKRLVGDAVDDGDAFLLQSVYRALGEEPDRATWARCADAAEAKGKHRYATTARRNAARGED
ncbi:MAG: hypothetical protein QF570_18585 [Myxococcota bacterium]|jgi:hypothetical protein|nr:hypothetical protein [Myxococcota bacterium]